jgi:hypothetical protein
LLSQCWLFLVSFLFFFFCCFSWGNFPTVWQNVPYFVS